MFAIIRKSVTKDQRFLKMQGLIKNTYSVRLKFIFPWEENQREFSNWKYVLVDKYISKTLKSQDHVGCNCSKAFSYSLVHTEGVRHFSLLEPTDCSASHSTSSKKYCWHWKLIVQIKTHSITFSCNVH